MFPAAVLASAAILASAPTPAPDATPPDFHAAPSADIIVTAPVAQTRLDATSSTAILQGDDLAADLRPSLGDTLAHTAGISASSFGPAASRPILRGLQGDRAPILTDGIGSIDASGASPDHAVAINPLLAERIEVVRGPHALLYSTSAIGGVVNVLDRRIPRTVPDEPVHLQGSATFGSAATERAGSGAADVRVGPRVVVHVDGSYQKTNDLRIGGAALSPAARATAQQSAALPPAEQIDADGDPLDFAANAAIRGRLPNTAGRNWTAGVGVAYIGDGGNLGLSYSHLANRYGVPVRYATRPGDSEEAPTIDLVQNRLDARAGVDIGGGVLKAINLRAGTASYRHFELEDDGAIGTTYTSKGSEGRLELVQADHGAWTGVTGAQFAATAFDVTGDEAFLPKNNASTLGLFTLQQLDLDAVNLQAALRFEHAAVTALPRPGEAFASGTRRFSALSASAGASLRLADGWRLGLNLTRSNRAPSADELYANGPHAGTQSYEIGDPNLRPEQAWGAELVLRGRGDGYTLEASAYASRYANFIYQTPTGARIDGLPVYATQQGHARYYGFELQGQADILHAGDVTVSLDGLADYVRATIRDVGPAPLIPPLRVLAGVGATSTLADLHMEVEHVRTQRRVAAFETPTAGYTLVNAEVTVRPWGDARPLTLVFSADNLFNVTARRHTSLLKDFAPLAGRDLRATLRFSF